MPKPEETSPAPRGGTSEVKPAAAVPTAARKKKEAPAPSSSKFFKVQPGFLVGPWPEGRILSKEDLAAHSPDVDVNRLLSLGAIAPVPADDAEEEVAEQAPLPPGPENAPKQEE